MALDANEIGRMLQIIEDDSNLRFDVPGDADCTLPDEIRPEEILRTEASLVHDETSWRLNFGELLKHWNIKEIMYDTVLRCQQQAISAHRLVLVTHSAYFDDQFRREKSYRSGTEITLSDVTPIAMNELLKWMYTGDIAITYENVLQIITAAKTLGIPKVEKKAEDMRNLLIADENIMSTLEVCERANVADLQALAYEKMNDRFYQQVQMPSFYEWPIDRVLRLLSCDDIKVTSEADVFDAAINWINYRRAEREQYFLQLVDCVRWCWMTQDEYLRCVDKEPQLTRLKETKLKITEANWFQTQEMFQHVWERYKNQMPKPRLLNMKMIFSEHTQGFNQSTAAGAVRGAAGGAPQRPNSGFKNPALSGAAFGGGGGGGLGGGAGAGGGQQAVQITQISNASNQKNLSKKTLGAVGNKNRKALKDVDRRSIYSLSAAADNNNGYGGAGAAGLHGGAAGGDRGGVGGSMMSELPQPADVRQFFSSSNHTIVLVGGHRGGSLPVEVASQVLILDPATGKWNVLCSLPSPRIYHSTLVVDNDIYVIGGLKVEGDKPVSESGKPQKNFWRLSATTGKFDDLPQIRRARHSGAAVAVYGMIHYMGGSSEKQKPTDLNEVYDPRQERWEYLAHVPGSRSSPAACVYEDRIFVAGGIGNPVTDEFGRVNILSDFWQLTVYDATWTQVSSMPESRCMGQMVEVDGLLYYIGGAAPSEGKGTVRSCSEIYSYDVLTDKWDMAAYLCKPRHSFAVARSGHFVFIIGGIVTGSKTAAQDVECFNVVKRTCQIITCPLPTPRVGCGAVVVER